MQIPGKLRFRIHRGADRLGPRGLLVLDCGASSTKAAVFARKGGGLVCERAVLLPPIDENMTFSGRPLRDTLAANKLAADYVSLVVSGHGVGMRVLSFPGSPGNAQGLHGQVLQAIGADPETTSVAFHVVYVSTDDQNRHFTVIAASMPRAMVTGFRGLVEVAGLTPVSLTTAGVAAANLARLHPEYMQEGMATGFLELGAANSFLILFNQDVPALARLFRFGAARIIAVLQKNIGLDEETALNLYRSGSLDYSANAASVLEPWLHQISISLDFLERRYGRPVKTLRLFGGGARSPVLERILNDGLGCAVLPWRPMTDCAKWLRFSDETIDSDVFALAAGEALRVMMPALQHAQGGKTDEGKAMRADAKTESSDTDETDRHETD